MIAIMCGIGGFLSYLVLHIAARGITSLRRSKKVPIRGQPPKQSAVKETRKQKTSETQLEPLSKPTHNIPQSTQREIYWQERGDRLVGTYQTQNHSYAGYLTDWELASREFFIVNPPQSLRDHSQDNRLIHRGNGRYLVRFAKRPIDARAGIQSIEHALAYAEGAEGQLARPPERETQAERLVVEPVQRARIVVTPVNRERTVVKPKYRPYWQTQDWMVDGDKLVGQYKTPLGSTVGYIEHYKSREPLFYVVNPPAQLHKYPHRHCFQSRESRGKGHYWVHFGIKPRNPDSGILEIEKNLMEALRLPRR